MNLPDAPIAEEGFYVAHFLTVKDQAKSREFYVGVLGGNGRPGESHLHQARQFVDHSELRRRPDARQAGRLSRDSARPEYLQQLSQPARGRYLGLLRAVEGEGRALSDRAARQPRPRNAMLHARSRRLHHRGRTIYSSGDRRLQAIRRTNRVRASRSDIEFRRRIQSLVLQKPVPLHLTRTSAPLPCPLPPR